MALQRRRFKGVSRKGKIELEPGAQIPDGAEVVVLFEKQPGASTESDRSTALDLLNSEIVGLWSDRTGIEDSAEFARKLRERAWKRAS